MRCIQFENTNMKTTRYVYWKDGDTWLGYREEYPDYMRVAELQID